ncbi:MAG: hypothetical protein ACRD1V_05505 [Vicinamibacterales bacterium]
MSNKKTWQWVALGCAGIVVLTLATAAFFTFLYWPKINAVYHRAKATASETMHFSVALQRQYGGHVAFAMNRQSGVAGMTLHITLTNPTFLENGDPGEQTVKDTALEVAAEARRALTAQYPYEHYEIQFVRDSGTAGTASRSWSYTFNAAELPPAKTNR